MFKKLTLASLATLALLMLPAQAERPKCQAGKCGAGMMEKSKPCKGKSCDKDKSCKKMKNKGQGSAYLVPLPSPMRFIMKHENDAKFGLSAEQKEKLTIMRGQMMPKIMRLKEDIQALTKKIKTSCKAGTKLSAIQENVEKLARLKTHATMTKLGCIEKVKEVLNDKQEAYIKEFRKVRNDKKSMKKQMKCQADKCAGN